MKENWYALCVSILTEKSVERSLGEMEIRPNKNPKKNLHLTIGQALHLKFLRETTSWPELALEFGINGEALRQQVNTVIKKATENPDQSVPSSIVKQSNTLYHKLEVIQC